MRTRMARLLIELALVSLYTCMLIQRDSYADSMNYMNLGFLNPFVSSYGQPASNFKGEHNSTGPAYYQAKIEDTATKIERILSKQIESLKQAISYHDEILKLLKSNNHQTTNSTQLTTTTTKPTTPTSQKVTCIPCSTSTTDHPSTTSATTTTPIPDGTLSTTVKATTSTTSTTSATTSMTTSTNEPTQDPTTHQMESTHDPAQSTTHKPSKHSTHSPGHHSTHHPTHATDSLLTGDQECGRVPLFERKLGKSINETLSEEEMGQSRIIFGQDSVFGEWPWIARAKICKGQSDCTYCTGSLLNSKWIITAAHCGINRTADDIEITFGLYDLINADSLSFTRTVDKLVIHPEATAAYLENDISLMRLSKPVQFNDYIQPVCLIGPTRDVLATTRNKRAYSIGYGMTAGMVEAIRLQKLQVKPRDPSVCNSDNLDSVQLKRNTICLSPPDGKKGGSCNGDSGGPNVYYDASANRWFLFSTVSYGPPDCDREDENDKWLAVSVDLSNYRTWILSTIGKDT